MYHRNVACWNATDYSYTPFHTGLDPEKTLTDPGSSGDKTLDASQTPNLSILPPPHLVLSPQYPIGAALPLSYVSCLLAQLNANPFFFAQCSPTLLGLIRTGGSRWATRDESVIDF